MFLLKKTAETRPLSEVIAQNTVATRKNREQKIQTFAAKVYDKILEKIVYHSTHFSTNELKVSLNNIFSESGDKLFVEFSSGDKTVEPITSDEYQKMATIATDKLTSDKFQVITDRDITCNTQTVYSVLVSWEIPAPV